MRNLISAWSTSLTYCSWSCNNKHKMSPLSWARGFGKEGHFSRKSWSTLPFPSAPGCCQEKTGKTDWGAQEFFHEFLGLSLLMNMICEGTWILCGSQEELVSLEMLCWERSLVNQEAVDQNTFLLYSDRSSLYWTARDHSWVNGSLLFWGHVSSVETFSLKKIKLKIQKLICWLSLYWWLMFPISSCDFCEHLFISFTIFF